MCRIETATSIICTLGQEANATKDGVWYSSWGRPPGNRQLTMCSLGFLQRIEHASEVGNVQDSLWVWLNDLSKKCSLQPGVAVGAELELSFFSKRTQDSCHLPQDHAPSPSIFKETSQPEKTPSFPNRVIPYEEPTENPHGPELRFEWWG